MTNSSPFPFTTRTRDGQTAHVLGLTKSTRYPLVGYIEPALPTSWTKTGGFFYSTPNHSSDLMDVPNLPLPLTPQPGKRYRTRNGSIAHITHLSTHPTDADFPLFGVVIAPEGKHHPRTWTPDGCFCGPDHPYPYPHDLIEEVNE